NLALNVILICTPLKVAGLAWSTAICAMLQVTILLRLVARHSPRPVERAVMTSWLMSAIMTSAMALGVLAVNWLWPATSHWAGQAIRLSALVLCGGVIYALASLLLRRPELHWAIGRPANADGRRSSGHE